MTATPYYASVDDTVQITGDGMNANENVTVDVNYPDASLGQEHVVAADGSGNFADSYTIKDTDPSGIYNLTATGQTSGIVFTTTFDPVKNVTTSTTLNLSSGSITIGSSISLSGTLSWTDPTGLNNGTQSRDGRTIHLNSYTTSNCGGTAFDGFTVGSGGTADNYSNSKSACQQLDVDLIATSLGETLTPAGPS